MKNDFYSLLDRYLAGDLSPSEEAAMRELASQKPKYGALLRDARQYASLLSSTLLECQKGTASAPSHTDELELDTPDLSQIDHLMAGMLSPQQEEELRNSAANSPIFASELKDADALAQLLTSTLRETTSQSSPPLVSGHELVDRYMAGDLDTSEQAELLSLASNDSKLSQMLDEARSFETLMKESLAKAGQGRVCSAQESNNLTPELTLIDDLIDRYMAGELTKAEHDYLKKAAQESSSVARKLQQADAFAALMLQPARQSNPRRASESSRSTSPRSSSSGRLSSRQTPAMPTQVTPRHEPSQASGRVLRLSSRRIRRRISLLAACLILLLGAGGIYYASTLIQGTPPQKPVDRGITANRQNPQANDIPVVEDDTEKTPIAPRTNEMVEAPDTTPSETIPGITPTTEDLPRHEPNERVEGPTSAHPPTPGSPDTSGDLRVENPDETTSPPSVPKVVESELVPPVTNEILENEASEERNNTTSVRVKDIMAFLDKDALVMREQAFISFRKELKELQLDDGTFNIWGNVKEGPIPLYPRDIGEDVPNEANPEDVENNEETAGNADHASGNTNHEASSQPGNSTPSNRPIRYRHNYIPEKAAVNALCVRALLVAGEPTNSSAVSKGIGAVLTLYEETLGLGATRKLSTQDAASILSLFERYYARSPDRHGKPRYNRVSNVHAKVIRDIVLFLSKTQHSEGLWPIGGTINYGDINNPGTINHWAGREVEYDLVSTFAAIRGIEHARALRSVPIDEDTYVRLATTLIKLQSPNGVHVQRRKVNWDSKRGVYTPSSQTTEAQARGYTMTGDLVNAKRGNELQRNGLATSNAVYLLGICRQNIRETRKNREFLAKLDQAYDDALAWVEYYFSVEAHPYSFDDERVMLSKHFHYLYLFSMHEALSLRSSPVLGATPWYRDSVHQALKEFESQNTSPKMVRESLAPPEVARLADPFIRHALSILLMDDRGLLTPDGTPLSELDPRE